MRKRPKISVIIPAFNEEKFLPRCLASLNQSEFKDFEIIVVDNNSEDKTAEIGKAFGARVFREKRQGVAFARQKGAEKARGEILAFSDADTILPKNWLTRIAQEFEADEELIAFGGSCELYSGPLTARLASRLLLKLFFKVDQFFSGGPNLMGSNMAIRKEAFWGVGGFATQLKLNEDVEISYKLKKFGKIKFDPAFKVKTSGRRFRYGLIWGLANYAPTLFSRWFFKKFDRFQFFPPQREEESLFATPFSFFLLMIFLLIFSLSSPAISRVALAKNQLKENFEKIALAGKKLRSEIKADLLKIKDLKIKDERTLPYLR